MMLETITANARYGNMAAKIGLDYEAIDANIPLTAFGEHVC